MKLAISLLAGTVAASATAGPGIFGTKSSPLPSTSADGALGVMPVFQMLLALGVVLLIVKWLLPMAIKKYSKPIKASSTGGVRVEDTATIGATTVSVIAVRGKVLLIGSNAAGVSCLADLTSSQDRQPLPTFHEMLEQNVEGPKTRADELSEQLERLKRLGL